MLLHLVEGRGLIPLPDSDNVPKSGNPYEESIFMSGSSLQNSDGAAGWEIEQEQRMNFSKSHPALYVWLGLLVGFPQL